VTRAVVFAYHNVGVRCLRTLLAAGIEVPLVVTHDDAPGEQIWFDSVRRHAAWHGLPVVAPEDVNSEAVHARVAGARPDFIFSFYFRQMLKPRLLALAGRGAYNMHGSLLPKYRGRVPVNWAIVHGETATGATLHVMEAKPDAGDIVDQQAVPILPDDTAIEVFNKVTVAAEILLARCLPGLLAGTASHRRQDLAHGSYFGRRTAEDGRIDWRAGLAAAHNLVRAVAPPYPGAFCDVGTRRLRILRSLPAPEPRSAAPALRWHNGEVCVSCPDGALRLLEFEFDGTSTPAQFLERFGEHALHV
jgi:methionyl-tRNA formyltransferase